MQLSQPCSGVAAQQKILYGTSSYLSEKGLRKRCHVAPLRRVWLAELKIASASPRPQALTTNLSQLAGWAHDAAAAAGVAQLNTSRCSAQRALAIDPVGREPTVAVLLHALPP